MKTGTIPSANKTMTATTIAAMWRAAFIILINKFFFSLKSGDWICVWFGKEIVGSFKRIPYLYEWKQEKQTTNKSV